MPVYELFFADMKRGCCSLFVEDVRDDPQTARDRLEAAWEMIAALICRRAGERLDFFSTTQHGKACLLTREQWHSLGFRPVLPDLVAMSSTAWEDGIQWEYIVEDARAVPGTDGEMPPRPDTDPYRTCRELRERTRAEVLAEHDAYLNLDRLGTLVSAFGRDPVRFVHPLPTGTLYASFGDDGRWYSVGYWGADETVDAAD